MKLCNFIFSNIPRNYMSKRFYCVYCNAYKHKSQKTKEHFIPRSIGGIWEINICDSCNNFAANKCDSELSYLSMNYKLYSRSIIESAGIAILENGKEIPAFIKLKHTGKTQNLIYCKDINNQNDIRTLVQAVKFKCRTINDSLSRYSSFAKIALGSCYYLIARNGYIKKAGFQENFKNLTFAGLREAFLGKNNFTYGGVGKYFGPEISFLSSMKCQQLQNERSDNYYRRHYISASQNFNFLSITIILFSEFFVEIKLKDVYLPFDKKLEDEVILSNIAKISEENLPMIGNLMHLKDDVYIQIAID